MSKGILVHAFNNEEIDYIKQARMVADRAKKYLDLPTSIITDCDVVDDGTFDHIMHLDTPQKYTKKMYNNGNIGTHLTFKNNARVLSYDLTPYDQTLMIDSDIIICDDTYKHCFLQDNPLLMYRHAYHLAEESQHIDYREFDKISDASVDFYWATCVYFTKCKQNKIFFDLLQHIEEQWPHYRMLYQITQQTYRNDFAFSIAAHIMNGHSKGTFVGNMPGKLYYTIDKDMLYDINNETLTFIIDNNPIKTKGLTVHAMNKYCLEELL
jgi:hypothetical protein|tara:strand:- start:2459 stop:3259 length:801 start_codon:yes stop_codon:yes gene_type:complete